MSEAAAGISASLYIKRAGLSVKLIGKDGGSLEKADKIQNYFGLEKAMSGSELIQIGLDRQRSWEWSTLPRKFWIYPTPMRVLK